MAQAQLDRLWTCMDQVIHENERYRGLGPSAVGLQCGGRDLAAFQRDLQAGVRDAVGLHADHVFIVRTPPSAGVGLALKAVFGGAGAIVPHERIAIEDVRAIDIVKQAPPGWSLIGDLDFLVLTTRSGKNWHWLDWASVRGQEQKLLGSIEKFRGLIASGAGVAGCGPVTSDGERLSSRPAFCRNCGARLDTEDAGFCGTCGSRIV